MKKITLAEAAAIVAQNMPREDLHEAVNVKDEKSIVRYLKGYLSNTSSVQEVTAEAVLEIVEKEAKRLHKLIGQEFGEVRYAQRYMRYLILKRACSLVYDDVWLDELSVNEIRGLVKQWDSVYGIQIKI